MLLESLPLVFVLVGLVLYAVLAGADFGAGFWQLFAGHGERGERIREHAHHSMSAVWEANHVWLIFVLTVFWTGYPRALAAIASTLAIPLFIAALGIVFRGAAYALRAGAGSEREQGLIDTIFSISSILTPFALGAAIGAIATNRVPASDAAAHLFASWLNPGSVLVGALAVASSAYLAAVYLAADAAALGRGRLVADFRARALAAGAVAGAVALAGLIVFDGEQGVGHSLLSGDALPAVIASFAAGLATLVLVYARRFQTARVTAAAAVALVVAAWALARWPTILPGLDVGQAAAGHDTLVWIVVVVAGGGAIVFPSLGLLFGLTLRGRFRAPETAAAVGAAPPRRPAPLRLLVRVSIACAVAGVGLLNLADASYAHAIGVLCLLGFAVTAVLAVLVPAIDEQP